MAKAKPVDATTNSAAAKWSEQVVERGYTIIPNMLLTHQSKIGLSSSQCMLVIHLLSYWWDSNKNPFPSKSQLAKRMGMSERQIQRHISELVSMGVLRRKKEDTKNTLGRSLVSYDLNGLVNILKKIDSDLRGQKASPEVVLRNLEEA